MPGFSEIPKWSLKTIPGQRPLLGRKFNDTSKAKKPNIEEESCMFCKKSGKPYNHWMR